MAELTVKKKSISFRVWEDENGSDYFNIAKDGAGDVTMNLEDLNIFLELVEEAKEKAIQEWLKS